MQYPVRANHEMMPGELGYAWVPLAMSAAQAAMESQNGAAGGAPAGAAELEQNPGMPGANPNVPRQPGALTTVSPTIQAQISPQISPVMSQVQSSPGATVSASPTQYMPGGQTAEGGGSAVSPYGGYAAPGMPSGMPGQPTGQGFPPYAPYGLDPMTGNYAARFGPFPTAQFRDPSESVGGTIAAMPWTPIAVVALAGLGAMVFLRTRKGR